MEQSVMERVRIRPLTGSAGAIVEHARIQDLDSEQMRSIKAALWQYSVLIFRGQKLTPDEQLAFTERWGPIYVTPYVEKLATHPTVLPVKNWGKAKTVTEAWHSDASFQPEPPGVAILAVQVIPPAGGDTLFANTSAAYDALSDRMKKLISDLRCVHHDTVLAKFAGVKVEDTEPVSHPVVRTHPESRRPSLYVNTLFSSHFEGMTAAESQGLLQYLCEHAHSNEFCYRHTWQLGDVLVWDNRCSLHYAVHDYGTHERLLYRTTVVGGRPV